MRTACTEWKMGSGTSVPLVPRMSAQRRAIGVPWLGLANRAGHELAAVSMAARRLGGILGLPCLQEPVVPDESLACYCIPISTLNVGEARAHGIRSEEDFWGGIVPYDFVGTKLISHPAWPGGRHVPKGWRALAGIESCTLPGFSLFDACGAESAIRYLLNDGSVRIKAPYARGGNGQRVLHHQDDIEQWLEAICVDGIGAGLVVERNLRKSVTHSVGSAYLLGREISYYGQQGTTLTPDGEEVYAGSTLTVFNGPLSSMLREVATDRIAEFASAAARYDDIVRGRYGVIASRRNYDVIEGIDDAGRRHVGVLEQSWRFGGASMAEVLAFEYFSSQPALRWVTAETVETYAACAIPSDAVVTWPGDAGFATPLKYARIVCDGRRT